MKLSTRRKVIADWRAIRPAVWRCPKDRMFLRKSAAVRNETTQLLSYAKQWFSSSLFRLVAGNRED